MLTIDTIPLKFSFEFRVKSRESKKILRITTQAFNSRLFVFFMQLMATAATAEFLKFKPIRRVLFILCRCVIALFAFSALQNNIISWHFLNPQ